MAIFWWSLQMVCRQANFHSLWWRLTGAIQGEANWEGKILADVISKTTDKLSPEVRERAVRQVLGTEGQIGEVFGWARTVGGMAQTVYRGVKRVRSRLILMVAASNLIRLPLLLVV